MKKNYFTRACIIMHLLLIFFINGHAANETMASGSLIINMGVTPQTINNGLKPYGLVYALLKNHQVPVKWIINSSKVKDGADFTYNGVEYKGGPFIIPAEFRSTAVNTTINTWIAAGVIGITTTSALTVEVYTTLRFVPQWTLDQANGKLVTDFFINAGIPASAHGGSLATSWKLPSQLGLCDDVFALPHADPTWANHQNLYYWNLNFKGNIWSGCHAVSVLENVTNPGASIQMNFLSSTGLVSYLDHTNGSPPYIYQAPVDQIMQFMGNFDGSTTNGSEQIYLPKLAGSWRTGTKILVYDPSQSNVPTLSPGPATVAIYGRGYNDTTRGYVMYQAGHDLDKGTVAERVAAQRAFFNFSFFSTQAKVQIPYIDLSPVQDVVRRGDTINFNYIIPPGYESVSYTKKWTNSCGGRFIPNDTIRATKFIVPLDPNVTTCVITIKLTDICGRENFASKQILVVSLLENGWGNLTGNLTDNNVRLQWNTANEDNLERFAIERSTNGNTFTEIGSVQATNKLQSKTYYYIDRKVEPQAYFYRIRAIDKQQKPAFSNIIFIADKNRKITFKVVPNPVTASTTLTFYSDKDESLMLYCFDLSGKQVAATTAKIKKGETKIDFREIKQLKSGMYILKAQAGQEMIYQKFVVSK